MTRFVTSMVHAIGSSWCQLMHPDPMWPVNGQYTCRVCLRKYPVSWENETQQEIRMQHAPSHLAAKGIAPVTITTTVH
jgi:hypothetical protein